MTIHCWLYKYKPNLLSILEILSDKAQIKDTCSKDSPHARLKRTPESGMSNGGVLLFEREHSEEACRKITTNFDLLQGQAWILDVSYETKTR